MYYFATPYTIHFDDTMTYGSHHFLTSFKFQCFSRESFLFGERIFDVPGVRESLDSIHLLTADAYARNLNPARLGDRVAILLTIEEWQRASARFCYRVIGAHGTPICAGFQSLICADAHTGKPVPIPAALWDAMEKMRDIEEPFASESFRARVLAGGSKCESLFGEVERSTAVHYLVDRYPSPKVIPAIRPMDRAAEELSAGNSTKSAAMEAWVFAGQGAFDPGLLSTRVMAYKRSDPSARRELDECASIAAELIGGDAQAVVSGIPNACSAAVEATPGLSQFAIHLQNVLGAYSRRSWGNVPGVLMGHSFGEIAAFGVAGCFDLPTGVRIVCRRVRALEEHAPPDGAMLAVLADRATVVTEAALHRLDEVVIAGRNHERQTVVSGPRGQLDQLRACLGRVHIKSLPIPSPTSFHHPRLRSSALAWFEHLKELPLGSPVLPLYSPVGRRFISPREDVAAALASQLLRPFDFQGAVFDLLEAGVTRFVDCGSSGSLARIIAKAGPEGLDVGGIDDGRDGGGFRAGGPDVAGVGVTGRGASRATGSPDRCEAAELPFPQDPGHEMAEVPGPTPAKRRTGEGVVPPPVAIVAQGCILPGGASSPEGLFAAITRQRTGIVDQRRFDPHWEEDFYSANLVSDRSTSHLAGRIEDQEIIAPAGVDQTVFNQFSRAQRLLCMALAPCAESLVDARRVMCFVGATADGFEDQDAVSSLRLAGIDPADRDVDERLHTVRPAFQEPFDAVREVFDRIIRPGLEIMLVDAACASSLYSVALGLQALETYKADAVIAGGAFCPGPGTNCLFSQFRAMTSTGCRPYSATADGVVFSEGAAMVTLRRAADAQRLGLPIAAVVRGVGLSSDGRSSSANVPQTGGQILSLQRCYEKYGIDPASLDAIEGHGTGTPVGDTTELETLRRFFSGRAGRPIMLHSLKALLGHAGWAAGAASIIAACEYLRNGVFPALANHDEPSEGLIRSADTLGVLTQARPLPSGVRRIGIDGFGFGGTNAHVVLESPAELVQGQSANWKTPATPQEDALVFVASHEVVPTLSTKDGLRFDREHLALPKGHVLLPDLADDMDISQKLAVSLVDGIIAKLPRFDAELRRETGVLLAQSGKTERGVGATLRVLAQRFRRRLAGLDHVVHALTVAADSVRPSGPYTLQCMMPNVAAGRAALQLNLNGPNFVVDAGSNSLESAMAAASLLLHAGDRSGTKLIVVTTINANPWRVPFEDSRLPEEEFAAAFAVTTRRYAEELGLSVVSPVEEPLKTCCAAVQGEGTPYTTARKVRRLLDRLHAPPTAEPEPSGEMDGTPPAGTKFPIYAPVWVEVPTGDRTEVVSAGEPAVVAIVPAQQNHVARLAGTLPNYARRWQIVVFGAASQEVVSSIADPRVIAADLADENSIDPALAQIDRFGADVILAMESIAAWDRTESLARLATDNGLCELLFLIARRNVSRLARGELDLWGLFHDGWDGTVHPASGPVAGLLKAIAREIAGARVGVVCTRDRSLSEAVECVLNERRLEGSEREVVYDGATRLARRFREAPGVTEASARLELNSDSVVLATGGARGVTAVLMDALLRDYQCTVVALGRSVPEAGPEDADDPAVEEEYYAQRMRRNPHTTAAEMKREFEKTRACWESHRTIQRLSTLGGKVEYMVADVTDRKQIAGVIRQIASKYGRIDLLVHGAGVQKSMHLESRGLAEFRRAFSVKVGGLRHLTDQYRMEFGRPPVVHVLTSAYSVFGNDGQHDYGAANETLDRLCGMSAAGEGPGWSSIAWLAWDGIGMTRGSEYRALSKRRGLSGLTAEDGQRIFRAVLAGRTGASINMPLSETEHAKFQVPVIPPPGEDADGRLLERRIDLSKMDFLSFHRVRGVPTLPGAWILDCMVTAGLELQHGAVPAVSVTVRDARFHRFIRYPGNECNLRVVAQEAGEQIAVWMIGDIRHPKGAVLSKDVVFAEAVLSFEAEAAEMQPPPRSVADREPEENGRSLRDPYCSGHRGDIELSGPFDCLRDIAIGPAGRHARFDPGHSNLTSTGIPALVLDAALRVGAMYAVPGKNDLYVPVRIGHLVIPVGPRARSFSESTREIRSTAPRVEENHASWARSEVFDDDGVAGLVVEDAYASRLQ